MTTKAEKPWVYQTPVIATLIFFWVMLEKMVAHEYLVTLIYAGMPAAYSYGAAAVTGAIGLVLVWKGLHKEDEVKGTWFGYVGGALLWTSWFEMYMHFMGAYNGHPIAVGDGQPFFLGEHAFLQSSSIFVVMIVVYMTMNKDVRCRMMLWIRNKLGLRPGKATKGYRPQVARVAATEVMFVNWFMYVLMMAVLDERYLGAMHPFTQGFSVVMALWGLYLFYKQTQQKEVGMAIRYAIGAVGVFWYTPEYTTLIGWYREPWVYYLDYPITASLILIAFIVLTVVVYKTPVNKETGKSL